MKSAFIKLFGDSPRNRITDFLLDEGRTWDYSLSDIAKHSDVAMSTFNVVWPSIMKMGIVRQTRIIGKAKMYQLDTQSPYAKALVHLDFDISKATIKQKHATTEKVVA